MAAISRRKESRNHGLYFYLLKLRDLAAYKCLEIDYWEVGGLPFVDILWTILEQSLRYKTPCWFEFTPSIFYWAPSTGQGLMMGSRKPQS